MNIKAKKLELVQLILDTEQPSILDKISKIFKKEKEADWWDTISDEERAGIQEGIAQADRGELIAHEEVMAKYSK
jgi:predicted transcriptional regulator